MQSTATTIAQYINELPEDKKQIVSKLHELILAKLPKGFEAWMSYGMISYVVPHSLYPAGYHVNPQQPLPFAALAAQKNNISFYHMAIYAVEELNQWFQTEYSKEISYKLNMGKSCIRFTQENRIPYELIAELMQKISVEEWIKIYESKINQKQKS